MNERIKEVRKALDLSQAKFGEAIGVSGPAVAKIESGINNPSESTIKLICATYNVDYRWLTTGQGEMYLAGESELTKAIMKAFAKLPDEECDKWFEMLKRIKKEGV